MDHKIKNVRAVLLSAPYADQDYNLEVKLHLKSGYRTTGMVEITLDDGTTGLGEGYLAVFAPHVFTSIVDLFKPYLIGKSISDFNKIYQDILLVSGYWSMQGAAQHVVSAIEIALQDCRAKIAGKPVYDMLGGAIHNPIKLYGSGGDAAIPKGMEKEFEYLEEKGIDTFKIRARKEQVLKAVWCQKRGEKSDIKIAVDMTQNLMNPGQSVGDVVLFYDKITQKSGLETAFLEEVLGPNNTEGYSLLKNRLTTKLAGGEIVTTSTELCTRLEKGYYDIVQPDATVIGGITPVMEVISEAKRKGTEAVVHCWGGPVGMMANYHAAIAGGGTLAEWPMPYYPLRDALVTHPWEIKDGFIKLSDVPGLGVQLTPEIEKEFPFREDAIYSCLVDNWTVLPPHSVWKEN